MAVRKEAAMKELKSEYIHIKITPELKKEVQDYCDATGRTMTSFITWLIERELQKEKAAD